MSRLLLDHAHGTFYLASLDLFSAVRGLVGPRHSCRFCFEYAGVLIGVIYVVGGGKKQVLGIKIRP